MTDFKRDATRTESATAQHRTAKIYGTSETRQYREKILGWSLYEPSEKGRLKKPAVARTSLCSKPERIGPVNPLRQSDRNA